MSLSARDRQALSQIEEDFARSDPRFAARLSAFSRLTDGEEMPAIERIRPRLCFCSRRSLCSRRCLCWAVGITWLVISVALLTVALILSHGSASATITG